MKKSDIIMSILSRTGEMYGLEIVDKSNGLIKRGTVYATLQRMKKRGLVTERSEPAPEGERGPERVKYALTPQGQEELDKSLEAREAEQTFLRLLQRTLLRWTGAAR